jgi:uncharacterized protein (TIGR03790 family)
MTSHPKVARRSVLGVLAGSCVPAVAAVSPVMPPASSPPRAWIRLPRPAGRLTARELGLVVNTADPYSVEVGEAYLRARKLDATQVLELELPTRPALSASEFEGLAGRVRDRFDAGIQALALAWRMPYAVGCNSITGALALGLDAGLCRDSCGASKRSRYFASPSTRPWGDFGMRLSMLLAAPDAVTARALIERGVTADGSLARRGGPTSHAHFLVTDDRLRNVRVAAYPPAGRLQPVNVQVHVDEQPALVDADRVLLYLTGRTQVEGLETVQFVPGALADHLTSTGGALDGSTPQMTALAWIAAGATASHGTVSEPCARTEKFPHPQVLLLSYLQGCTAIEAYWRSVACPQQSVFVGEPLAAPFAPR